LLLALLSVPLPLPLRLRLGLRQTRVRNVRKALFAIHRRAGTPAFLFILVRNLFQRLGGSGGRSRLGRV
jgi:hypothetical protein